MLKVSRVLHAGTLFEAGSTRVLVDPIFEIPFSISCHAYPPAEFDLGALALEKFDAIVISHYHDDHCSFESLKLLDRSTPLYMFCVHDEMFELLRELGFETVVPLRLRETIQLGEISLTTWPALDRDVDCLLQFTDGHSQVLNVVDSWIDFDTVEELAKIAWDLILWPFQTMLELDVLSPSRALPASRQLPPEWIEQLKTLSPRAVVPSSCQFIQPAGSWMRVRYFPISYAQFEREVRAALHPSTQILRLDPGQCLSITPSELQRSEPLKFIRLTEPSAVADYDYKFQIEIPSLSTDLENRSVAESLRPITDEVRLVVETFLLSGLAKRFSELQETEEPYFQSPRIWCLRVIEPAHVIRDFYFEVDRTSIRTCGRTLDQTSRAIGWLTEIPFVKLYSSLIEGESLSSLLVRINDQKFESKTEEELAQADFLQDPLLRVLYEEKFASYQKAQLARIKKTPWEI